MGFHCEVRIEKYLRSLSCLVSSIVQVERVYMPASDGLEQIKFTRKHF